MNFLSWLEILAVLFELLVSLLLGGSSEIWTSLRGEAATGAGLGYCSGLFIAFRMEEI